MDAAVRKHERPLVVESEKTAAAADEMRRYGRRLLAMADDLSPSPEMPQAAYTLVIDDAQLAAEALDIYKARRARGRFLPEALFAEPSWDMLLDLFAQTIEGKRITTTSLCLASGTALTTCLRWLRQLEHHQLIQRGHAVEDRRLTIIQFTPKGFADMRAYLRDRIRRRIEDNAAPALQLPAFQDSS